MMKNTLEELVEGISSLLDWLKSGETQRELSLALSSLILCSERKGTIFVAGNGGSAAEASHFAAELVATGIRCVSLASDLSVMTALSNDFNYDNVFSFQLGALGKEGDFLLALTTSGRSQNVRGVLSATKGKKISSLVLTGGKGVFIEDLADQAIFVPSIHVGRIQEIHLMILHWFYQGLRIWKNNPMIVLDPKNSRQIQEILGHTNLVCLAPRGGPCICSAKDASANVKPSNFDFDAPTHTYLQASPPTWSKNV